MSTENPYNRFIKIEKVRKQLKVMIVMLLLALVSIISVYAYRYYNPEKSTLILMQENGEYVTLTDGKVKEFYFLKPNGLGSSKEAVSIGIPKDELHKYDTAIQSAVKKKYHLK